MNIEGSLQESFTDFLSQVPANRLKHNMTKVVLAYIKQEAPTGLPLFFSEFLEDLESLFDLLDVIDQSNK